jgi:hypothetical protein
MRWTLAVEEEGIRAAADTNKIWQSESVPSQDLCSRSQRTRTRTSLISCQCMEEERISCQYIRTTATVVHASVAVQAVCIATFPKRRTHALVATWKLAWCTRHILC